MIKLNGHLITPTIFPDKTSQVWCIPDEYFPNDTNVITWEFENEAELLHVAQLKFLLDFSRGFKDVTLDLPYLPYARQDKPVTNTSTFAFMPFAMFLNTLGFRKVRVVDPHNLELAKKCIENIEVKMPNPDKLLAELNANIVFPDAGAAIRYGAKEYAFAIICDKDRDPLTGTINGIVISSGIVEAKPYLIVDDLIDGGRTFIEVANKLYNAGATDVYLYGSHGIFSKGLKPLLDAGIKRIFTYKGEVHYD